MCYHSPPWKKTTSFLAADRGGAGRYQSRHWHDEQASQNSVGRSPDPEAYDTALVTAARSGVRRGGGGLMGQPSLAAGRGSGQSASPAQPVRWVLSTAALWVRKGSTAEVQ